MKILTPGRKRSHLLVLLLAGVTIVGLGVNLFHPQDALAARPSWQALLKACSAARKDCPRLRKAFGERLFAVDGPMKRSSPAQEAPFVSGVVRLSGEEASQGSGWLKSRQTMRGQKARLLRISRSFGLLYQPAQSAFVSNSSVVEPFMERQLLLDRAEDIVGLTAAQQDYGVDGQGVYIGVVDSGIDINHPAFFDAQGKTRIAWYLVFDQSPTGVFPELEEEYGCVFRNDCAVYSRIEIDAALASGLVGAIGPDRNGHGSHVASIAAGSGDQYSGVAPGAELIIVKAGNSRGGLSDERILLGTQFIHARADTDAKPVVTNLSLGSSFGAHDGRSVLEEALEELATDAGHLICVAAGNEGALVEDLNSSFTGPYGPHVEIFLKDDEVREVPLLGGGSQIDGSGSIFLWLRAEKARSLSIAFDDQQGHLSDFVEPGNDEMFDSETLGDSAGDYEVLILNNSGSELPIDVELDERSAIVIISGSFAKDRSFSLQLKGSGKSDLWLEASGEFGPASSGFFLSRARSAGTVTIPGTAQNLITVGSSTNRNSWPTLDEEIYEFFSGEVGHRSDFSGAGPNSIGFIKPDLIAPGGAVIAAMSAVSDPRSTSLNSNFSGEDICSLNQPNCLVVNDLHGVSIGTSMSSPLVAGALALALSRDAELTQLTALELIRASTRAIPQQAEGFGEGAGQLAIDSLLLAQDRRASSEEIEPRAAQSRIVLADSYIRPGSTIKGLLLLRDAEAAAAGGYNVADFRGEVSEFAQVSWDVLNDEQPFGSLAFEISLEEEFPGEHLVIDLFFRDELLASREVLVADELPFSEPHEHDTSTGCSLSVARRGGRGIFYFLILIVLIPRKYFRKSLA